MSHSSSPTNRNSIFGWVKSLKRSGLMSNESVNEISDKEEAPPPPLNSTNTASELSSPSSIKQDFLRPSLLTYKSRSANNVNRIRSNSLNQSDKSLRQHRDSYLQNNSLVDENSKYFGVPLEEAINQSCAKISILTADPDNVLQYGRIPIVVAKCAIYIKKNGLNVEGIFRVGGSSKRLKELQVIFNTPPDFGKKLNWDGYTVHDASSILRRYLNALPEPLIPLDLYEEFRDPLRERQRIINYMKYKAENPSKPAKQSPKVTPGEGGAETQAETEAETDTEVKTADVSPETPLSLLDSEPLTEANIDRLNQSAHIPPSFVRPRGVTDTTTASNAADNAGTGTGTGTGTGCGEDEKAAKKSRNYKKLSKDVHDAIEIYRNKLEDLPLLSKQLLFYILDLLAMVNTQSSENLMSSRNLAAIFQPSILSHPNHDLDPVEYALSQSVVEFLIRYAYKLLPNEEEAPEEDKDNTNTQIIPEISSSPPADSLMTAPPSVFNRFHSKSISSSQSQDFTNNATSKSKEGFELDEINSIDYESTDDELSSNIHHQHGRQHQNMNKSNITLDSGMSNNNNNIDSVLNDLELEEASFKFHDSIHQPEPLGDTTITHEDTTISHVTEQPSAEVAIVVQSPTEEAISQPTIN